MANEAQFSVVVPTCRRLEYLREALESVAVQRVISIEVVVVNDAPEDREKVNALVASFQSRMPLIAVHHSRSLGGNAARNTGIGATRAPFVAFLDDDDVWLPNKLQQHLRAHLARPEAGLVYSDVITFGSEKRWPEIYVAVPDFLDARKDVASGRSPPTTSCVSVRRDLLSKVGGFDESLVSFQDWDLWFRLSREAPFAAVHEPLVRFRQHAGPRTSKEPSRRMKGLDQICAKWAGDVDVVALRRKFTGSFLLGAALEQASAGIKGEALSALLKYVKHELRAPRASSVGGAVRVMSMLVLGLDRYSDIRNIVRRGR